MMLVEIDAEQLRLGKQFGYPRGDLPGAATDIQNSSIGRERILSKNRRLLGPNRFRLGGQVADHGLIAHLARLRATLIHRTGRCSRPAGGSKSRLASRWAPLLEQGRFLNLIRNLLARLFQLVEHRFHFGSQRFQLPSSEIATDFREQLALFVFNVDPLESLVAEELVLFIELNDV